MNSADRPTFYIHHGRALSSCPSKSALEFQVPSDQESYMGGGRQNIVKIERGPDNRVQPVAIKQPRMLKVKFFSFTTKLVS